MKFDSRSSSATDVETVVVVVTDVKVAGAAVVVVIIVVVVAVVVVVTTVVVVVCDCTRVEVVPISPPNACDVVATGDVVVVGLVTRSLGDISTVVRLDVRVVVVVVARFVVVVDVVTTS